MKTTFTLKSSILRGLLSLFFLVAMVGNVWGAEDPDYMLDATNSSHKGSNNAYASACDITVDGITWNVTGNSTMNPWRIGGKSLSSTDREVYSKTAYTSAVEKITLEIGAASSVTINSIKLLHSTNADFSSATTINASGTSANTTYTFQPEGGFSANSYYKFVFNVTIGSSNKFIEFKNVKIYNKAAATKTLSSIAVSGTPTKTTYNDGEALDPAGLVVTGTYSDSSTGTITEGVSWTFNPATLTEGTTSCTATATVGSISSSAYSVTGLTVKAAKQYPATFYVNGSQLSTANYKEGEAVAFPATDPDSPNEDVVFIGWKQGDAISGTTDTKPELVTSATMGTNALTFHAVYATKEGDVVTKTLDFESATNSDWTVSGTVTRTAANTSYSANSGDYYGLLSSNVTIKFNNKVNVTDFSYYCVRRTTNTNTSIKIQTSTNGSTWTDAETTATGWNYFNSDGKTYKKVSQSFDGETECYVRLNVTTAANRQLDDISISYGNITYSNYCTTVADAPVLSSIAITTAPTKTKYKVGEVFDGTGMVVTATYEGGSTKTIASSKYTISKTTALATSDASITVSYKEGEVTKTATQTINVLALDHLTIATAPTKVTYEEGEKLAIAGMVVKGTWGTGETTIEEPITGYTTDPADGATLTFENTKFTVSYTHEGITKTVDQAITVTESPTCSINFFINSATPTVKQAKKGAAVDVPQVIAPVGFEFVGWANAVLEETTKAPASYAIAKNDTTYTVTADGANFYAVYKKIETTEYEGGFTLSFTDEEYIRYAGKWGSSYLAKVDDVSDAEIFFLEEDYLYYHASVGGAKTYLYNTDDNTTLSSSTTKPNESWTVTTNNENGTITFQSKATGNRYLAYNTAQPRFATYKNTNYILNKVDGKTKNVYSYSYSTSATVSALSSIAITTAPTKTDYFAGDDFEKAGMVVKATYENGKTRTVTDNVTIENSTNLTAGTTSLTVSYTENEVIKTAVQAITVTAIELSSIEITTAPTKVTYLVGDNFDAEGMVVTAHYNDSRKDTVITTYTVTDGKSLSSGKETVTISYTEGGITKTTTQAITVNSALQSIAITTNPTKMEYTEGETFDKTGMVVTATYANGETKEVETYTVTPEGALNTVGTQTMTVHYTENGTEKTATLDVTVKAYPTYSVTFKVKGQDDNVQTETVGKAGVFVPETPANIGDYTFAGWSTTEVSEETTTAPTYITITDGKFFPTEATNVYAVFTTNKNTEIKGFYLSAVVDGNTKYVGQYNSSGTRFAAVTSTSSAITFWFDNGLLYYKNGDTKAYTYTEGKSDLKSAITTTEPNKYLWTREENSNGVRYTGGGSRIFGHGGSNDYFRAYTTATSGAELDLIETESSVTITMLAAHYTITPSAAITPTLSFSTPTTTVAVDATVKNVATSSSSATVTYSSSDETVASVADDGTVSGHKYGIATITASVAEVPGSFYANSTSYEISVSRITPILEWNTETSATVYADNQYTYNVNASEGAVVFFSTSNSTNAVFTNENEPTVSIGKASVISNSTWTGTKSVIIKATIEAGDKYAYKQITKQLSIKDNRKTQTLAFAETSYEFGNGEVVANFTNELTGAKTAVTYASDNTAIAEVNEMTGEVTVHTNASGTATITVTAAANDNVVEDGIRYNYSQSTMSYTITVNYPKPTFSLAEGEYHSDQLLEISATGAEYIYYTIDGTTPTFDGENGTGTEQDLSKGNAVVALEKGTTTVKAIAVYADNELNFFAGAQASYTYTLVAPSAPTASFGDGGTVDLNSSITLSSAEGTKITYSVYDDNEFLVAETTSASNNAQFIASKGGVYTVEFKAAWDEEDGYSSDALKYTLKVSGPASVPFAYNGNASNLPTCFTATKGIGSYDNATTTKIKLDKSGYSVVLWYDDAADLLSFDAVINGTNSNDNVFVVSTSSDGTRWSALHTFTGEEAKLTGSATTYTFNLPSTARYIKWEYETKSSGNVGLGNIILDKNYSRTMSLTEGQTKWGTICLPYAVVVEDRSGAEYYNILGVTKEAEEISGIVLGKEEGTLVAGKPYIFKATADLYCPYSGSPASAPIEATGLVGNYTGNVQVPANCYILSSNKIRMVQVGATAYIGPNRAYLDLAGVDVYVEGSESNAIRFGFDGQVEDYSTYIQSVQYNAEESVLIFDLQGHKVQTMKPGQLYIVNGKKMFNK